jgi:hypothetical protein
VATGTVADPTTWAMAREMVLSAGIYVPDKVAYPLELASRNRDPLTTPPFMDTVAEGPTVASAQERIVIWHISQTLATGEKTLAS